MLAQHSPFLDGVNLSLPPRRTWLERAEVVILGGGLPALSLAYFLARAGLCPILLTPRADRAEHSVRGLGMAMPGHGEDPARLSRSIGEEPALQLFRFTQAALATLEELAQHLNIPFQRSPLLLASRTSHEARDLEASLPLLHQAGISAHLLEGDALRAASPGHFQNALRLDAGFLLNPVALGEGLLLAAWQSGAALYGEVVIHALEEGPEGVVVQTSIGTVRAEVVVHAGGVETSHVSPFLLNTVLPARVQLLAAKATSAGALEPGSADRVQTTAADQASLRMASPGLPGTANSGFEYWRSTPEGLLCVGGFRYLTLELGMELTGEPPHPRIQARQEGVLVELGAKPALELTHQWMRMLDVPCDNLPLIGALPGQPRQLVLTGLAGMDLTLGVQGALHLSQHLLELPVTERLPECMSPRRMV